MQTLRGQPGALGLARARARWVVRNDTVETALRIEESNVAEEVRRAERAMLRVASELRVLADSLEGDGNQNTRGIFLAEAQFAEDPQASALVAQLIERRLFTAALAVREVFERFASEIARSGDSVISNSSADVLDVCSRIVSTLQGDSSDLVPFNEPCIVLASDLTPYQTAMLARGRVAGIATIHGGASSHTAIVTRSLGIPSVMAVGESLRSVRDGEEVLLDGTAGEIVISPTEESRLVYEGKLRLYSGDCRENGDFEPAETMDGRRIKVLANVSTLADAENAKSSGAEGVGLFRTELLFLGRASAPSEDEQFSAYARAARLFFPHGVIIRALDLGGDKNVPFLAEGTGLNPLLGIRGIRLLLKHKEVLITQLRATLRASAHGRVSLMLPFVTTQDEVVESLELLESARRRLVAEGKEFGADLGFGVMVETPSAALQARQLSGLCDFLSIGTNDLVQHTMASDRTNSELSELMRADSPPVLKLIGGVVDEAHRAGIGVAVCGEAAHSSSIAPLLVGLGVDELSVLPAMVRQVKQTVRSMDSRDALRRALEIIG